MGCRKLSDDDKQTLAGLCRIEIKRWKAAAESNPNMRYMVALMEVALASLTAEPVAWWTGPEPTPTGELESVHDHETGSHSLPLICIDTPAIKPEQTMKPVKAPKQDRGTLPPPPGENQTGPGYGMDKGNPRCWRDCGGG